MLTLEEGKNCELDQDAVINQALTKCYKLK